MNAAIRTLLVALALVPALALAAESGYRLDRSPHDPNDLVSLQAGARTFVNYCLNCHGAQFMRYNRLQEIGLTEAQIRDNLMFAADKVGETMRVALPGKDGKEWFGVPPPDLSVIARARGADWLYTYLRTFYRDPKTTHGWNNAVKPAPGPVDPRRLLAASGFTGNMDGGSNHFNSEYNAFQTTLNKRFSKGLQLLSSYSWGKCMDNQSSLAEGKYQDFLNAGADWSRCSYDINHAFKLGYVYDLPFGRGRQFGGAWNGLVDGVLGGWAVEGIVQMQSGVPANIRTGVDRANVGKTVERPNVLRNPNLATDQRSVDRWFDTSAFALPEPFTFGNAGAFIVDEDGRIGLDLSIAKKFRIVENHALELRGEFFNLPNHVSFGAPGTTIGTPTFGVISSATSARQIQFGLRYSF